jgi:hypothetical protein
MLSEILPVSDQIRVAISRNYVCPGSHRPTHPAKSSTPKGQDRQSPRPIVQYSISQVGIHVKQIINGARLAGKVGQAISSTVIRRYAKGRNTLQVYPLCALVVEHRPLLYHVSTLVFHPKRRAPMAWPKFSSTFTNAVWRLVTMGLATGGLVKRGIVSSLQYILVDPN